MDSVNEMFKQELIRFKGADEAVRTRVVAVIVDAGAYEWLLEICEVDPDPAIKDYARLARVYSEGERP